jgi:CshA-type fibril repeat protein
MALAANGAAAAPAMSSTLSVSTVSAGSKVDLTTQIPAVSAVDNSTQEIVQTIDPTKVRLTAASDVIAPAGWTVTYSTDGTTFSATPSSWAAVVKVKATGVVNSGGATVDGKQITTTSASMPGTVNTTDGAARSGGDGYDTEFDSRGYIYNTYHHDYANGGLDCRKRSDGSFCSANWPFGLASEGFHSNFSSTQFFDEVNKHLWLPVSDRSTGTGFLCIDVSTVETPAYCGGSKAAAWHMIQARVNANEAGVTDIIGVNGKVYAWDMLAPRVLCYDYLANNGQGAACTDMPTFSRLVAGTTRATNNIPYTYSSFETAYGNVYGALNGVAVCFSATTMAKCTGWAQYDFVLGTNSSTKIMYLQPNASGQVAGVCFTADAQCFSSAGTRFAANTTVQAGLTQGWMSYWNGAVESAGSKLLWTSYFDKPSTTYCYDYATNAACANWAASTRFISGVGQMNTDAWRIYTLKLDPLSSDCMWTNGDLGQGIKQFTISTGTPGCSIKVNTVTFSQSALQPRLACSLGNDVSYHRFTIGGATAGVDYSSASLTVVKSNGEVAVSGGTTWSNITFNASGYVDLASLAYADLGSGATFKITYSNRSTFTATTGALTMQSTSAQLCLSVTANVACPNTIQITNLPTQLASFSATGATISSGGSRIDYSITSSDLSIAPPATASACGFQLAGQVAQGNFATAYPTSNIKPVAGAIATLRDSAGTILNDPVSGLPITAVTDASGNYSFGYLKAGTYKVSFADFPLVNGVGAGDVSMVYIGAARYAGGEYTMTSQNPAGNFTTIQNPIVSLAVSGTAGGADVSVKAAYVMRAVANNDTVSVKAGATANLIDVLLNDTPTTTASFTTSSLKICAAGTTTSCALTTLTVANQGTYTVSAGKISFTPLAGFTGPASAINYGVADGYSNTPQTVNASLTVTVVPAPTTAPDTLSGNLLAPITVDVLANDTAALGTTLDRSSVKLCASGTTTNCALTSVVIAGKGTYSVSALGIVTFTPETAFVGAAPALTYSVTDGVGNVVTNTVTATVTATPPVITTSALPNAAAGVALEPIAQTLTTGNNSLPATGAWSLASGTLPPGLNLNPNTGEITGTPTTLGVYPFTVRVTDAGGLSATKAESITVFNGPTVTTSPLSYRSYAGSPLTITDTATAGSGAIKTSGAWSATGLPAGMTIDATTGVISGTPTTDGVYTVTVKVTDVNALSDTEALTITVVTKPVITTVSPLPRAVQGVAITAIPQTKTVGTAPIPATGAWSITSGSLPAGLSLNPDTGEITGAATVTGIFPFTIKLTDSSGEFATKAESITVIAPPTITTTPLSYKFYANTANSITNTVNAGTGAIASSGWSATSLPTGMTINAATGVISGTPTSNGTFTVAERVTDINGLFDDETITITVVTKPIITTVSPLPFAVTGVAITPIPQTKTVGSGSIPATGAWSIVSGNLPAGLIFNPDNGEITGTPTVPGIYPFTVQLVASDGEIATKAESISVGAPPTITTSPLSYKYYNGTPVTLTNTATKGTANLMTTAGAWAATGLPTGLSINTTTGVISGTPTVDGSYTVNLTVQDVNGLTDTETLTINVVTKPIITTPTPLDQQIVGVSAVPETQTYTPGTASIPATGAWSIASGTLPPGLTIDPDTGEIDGLPTNPGVYTFTVKLTDSAGEVATKQLSCTVVAPPTITTNPLVYTNVIGTLATITNTASRGTAVIATSSAWSATGLPEGFTMDVNTGVITGIGSVEGEWDVDVTVTDAAGLSDATTLTLKVVAPPVITTDPIAYKVNVNVAITPIVDTADEGTAPIKTVGGWSAVGLPAGLAINADSGEITGTPTKAGSYLVMVTVTDDAGLTDSKALAIAVLDPAKNQTILGLPSELVDGAIASDKGYPLSALGTSTKKLPVAFTAGPATVCFVDSAKVLHLLGVGKCDVTATSGTGALLSVDKKSFNVLKAPQTVQIVAPGTAGPDGVVAPAATDSANGFKLVSKMSSGLNPVYTSLDPSICLVEDDGTVTWMSDLVATPNLNQCRVKVTQPGNANFYPLVDTPANIITVTASHVSAPAPAPVNPNGAVGAPRAPGKYFIGSMWYITITNTSVTIKPWSSGKFIGPITAAITIPYTVVVKGKVVKKSQACSTTFGITKAYKVNDPMAWKSKAFENAVTCVLNKDAFAYFKSGKPINATAKVTRDRRWPTTMKPNKGDDGRGAIIPKDIKNWKLNIG